MKLVIFACLAAVAVAAPQFGRQFIQRDRPLRPEYRPIAILRDNRYDNGDGSFSYDFEGENGIFASAVGRRSSQGQSNIEGSYRFTLPDGTLADVRYIADENGFRAESPLIPTPHPLPAHAVEQIRVAEEQRRRGIIWD
ncbi:cuticle protein AM1199-like [Homarus americanus]|uniref:cuticle protein AM1199-like n=1 Tax=Homarus americanus TaxID=6706 RepID=UPI001C44585F|nr:cuticle protein AM1199-like [Homarus americanus]